MSGGGARPRPATLVVRTWRESGDDDVLRMRVVEVGFPPAPDRTLCVTTVVAEACETVRRRLEELAAEQR